MEENWRHIKDYENLYEVSNLGQVRNYHSGIILRPQVYKSGYLYVSLYKEKKRKHHLIHRLVGIAFLIPPTDEQKQIDHINRVKTDNNVTNLRWATVSQNGMNKGVLSNNTSGYSGVRWSEIRKRWMVMLYLNNKEIYGGSYVNKDDAIAKRIELEKTYFKDYKNNI